MSQKSTEAKNQKKLLNKKHQLENQLKTPRKKCQPEPASIKKAQRDLGEVKKNLSKK